MASDQRTVVNPGISILAVDPGTTTGLALWDAWDKRLYVDQLDAGRGEKVRYKVHGGIIESASRRAAEMALAGAMGVSKEQVKAGRGLRSGKQGYMDSTSIVERGVVQVICDVLMATGPRTMLVVEDFVLGASGGTPSGKRDGLSPVRIANRLDQVLWDRGLITGDAWRVWQGHPWSGADGRGWQVRGGVVPEFKRRLTGVEMWRLGDGDTGEPVVWGGSGVKLKWQMPGGRTFLPGGVAAMDQWLKDQGMWMPGKRHGMDALEHLVVCAREMGAEVLTKPERIWRGGTNKRGERVSAKAALL